MRCIVHCAKDGERLGCVLSSLVLGRRDALHEHAGTPCMNMLCLKSCTAHTGFSAKIEVEMGHESHVSRSFYGFMVRDKGHCLLAFRYEHGSANGKQSNTIIAAQYHAAQLLESLRRHTVPMQ